MEGILVGSVRERGAVGRPREASMELSPSFHKNTMLLFISYIRVLGKILNDQKHFAIGKQVRQSLI